MGAPTWQYPRLTQATGLVSYHGSSRLNDVVTIASGHDTVLVMDAGCGSITFDNTQQSDPVTAIVFQPTRPIAGGVTEITYRCRCPDKWPILLTFVTANLAFNKLIVNLSVLLGGFGNGTRSIVTMGYFHDDMQWRRLSGQTPTPLSTMSIGLTSSIIPPPEIATQPGHFGSRVAVSGDGMLFAAAASNASPAANTTGAVAIYRYSAADFAYKPEALLYQAGLGDIGFGSCLSFNVDANMLAIGAPRYSNSAAAADHYRGAVFLYCYDAAAKTWSCDMTPCTDGVNFRGIVQAAASSTTELPVLTDGLFGYNCQFSPCDNQLFVAANGICRYNTSTTPATPMYGMVYMYFTDPSTFDTSFNEELDYPEHNYEGAGPTCHYGIGLCVTPDASAVVVSDDARMHSNNQYFGAVYVFNRIDVGAYRYESSVVMDDSLAGSISNFGSSVAMGIDRSVLLVGMSKLNSDLHGMVLMYMRDAFSTDWVLQKSVTSDVSNAAGYSGGLGTDLFLSRDGNTMMANAPYMLPQAPSDEHGGETTLYTRYGFGSWRVLAGFSQMLVTPALNVGGNTAVSQEFDTIVVGAPGSNNKIGVVYVRH